ncbi:hypothetical protein RI054_38g143570 [Pseudoscourfieldia marina]
MEVDKRSCEGVDVTCRHLIGYVLGAQHGRTPVHELVVQSAEKRLRDAEELFAATKTEAEDSEATIVLPQQQQQELGYLAVYASLRNTTLSLTNLSWDKTSVTKRNKREANPTHTKSKLNKFIQPTQSCNNNSNNSLSTTARVSRSQDY